MRLVAAFFNSRTGYFVEVGANDPMLRSQTWHLEASGWTGVLIEPQPDLAERLRATRSALVFAAACSSPHNAGSKLPLHVAGPLSSLNRKRMAPGAVPEVSVRTLDSLLEEADAPVSFDFLSVDVEGHELEVLSGFDIGRWKPRLILLEDHVADLSKHRYLCAAGYRLIRRYENNGWYVPKDSPVCIAPGDTWEILRKYYLALPIRVIRNGLRRLKVRLNGAARA
jgi:FkbM family methyltransferase